MLLIAKIKQKLKMFLTFDEIVEVVFGRISKDEIEYLQTIKRDDMIEFHSTVGRGIRNDFRLWHTKNPLTKAFFEDGDKYIVNGVNLHPDHPDTVSCNVLYRVWDLANRHKETI